ncbi:MAG: protein kinase [Candidatus Brocadiae bacterium]|nr:protein kinase [Candidatus Brocadiia bacterium]
MKTIMITEEDPLVLKFYSNTLTKNDYQTISALNADDTLKKLKIYRPDLLLISLSASGTKESSFLASIQKIAYHLPVILLTGKTSLDNQPQHLHGNSQIYRCLATPVNKQDLLNAVYQVLLETANLNMEQREFAGCYIESMIEIGGSGVVYKGKLGNNAIAIKILPPTMIQQDHQIVRFQREAKIMPQLRHPNIIEILKIGYEDSMPFIVMAYFSGETLHKILQKQQFFSLEETIHIVIQIAQGLKVPHSYGIIHRDIKPSNILYNKAKKSIKIIDFGIAKEINDDQTVTGKNQIVGTPDYMSPEQCQNQTLDEASDIYSLGITIYQMLTGELPFSKKNSVRTMMAHLHEPLSWPANPVQKIPLEIQKIVEKMLEKKRQNRYSAMDSLIEDLQSISDALFSKKIR